MSYFWKLLSAIQYFYSVLRNLLTVEIHIVIAKKVNLLEIQKSFFFYFQCYSLFLLDLGRKWARENDSVKRERTVVFLS